ncbi:hypothetical protein OMCYN_01522 [cyanobiont of Ornithocercus magnificus]|nr:hypothetical protein OMCYN_01522 [cyanobiont of Ornithocercus magnificus]
MFTTTRYKLHKANAKPVKKQRQKLADNLMPVKVLWLDTLGK